MISNFKLFCEGNDNIDWILDKLNRFGMDSLSNAEKKILNNTYQDNKYDSHYNKYICQLLTDYKNNDVTEAEAKKFIEKYISKQDLFDTLLQLLRDGKIDHLLNKN